MLGTGTIPWDLQDSDFDFQYPLPAVHNLTWPLSWPTVEQSSLRCLRGHTGSVGSQEQCPIWRGCHCSAVADGRQATIGPYVARSNFSKEAGNPYLYMKSFDFF